MATIQFFGRISDTMGHELTFNIPAGGLKLSQLRETLSADHDCADLELPSIRAALNDEIVEEDLFVAQQDTVTFFSPLSGG